MKMEMLLLLLLALCSQCALASIPPAAPLRGAEIIHCNVPRTAPIDFSLQLTPLAQSEAQVTEWLREELIAVHETPSSENEKAAVMSAVEDGADRNGLCLVQRLDHRRDGGGGRDSSASSVTFTCIGVPAHSVDRLFGGNAGLCFMRTKRSDDDMKIVDASSPLFVASTKTGEHLLSLSGMGHFARDITGVLSSRRAAADVVDSSTIVSFRHRVEEELSAFVTTVQCPPSTGSVFFSPSVLMSHSCPSSTACVTALCSCIGSTDVPAANQMCTTRLSNKPSACTDYPICIAAYTACVYEAAAGAKDISGPTCSTWGASLSVALANALSSGSPFGDSTVSLTCEAEMCQFMNSTLRDGNCTSPSFTNACSYQVTTPPPATTSTATATTQAVTTNVLPNNATTTVQQNTTAAPTTSAAGGGGGGNLTALQFSLTFPGDYSVLAANSTALFLLSAQLEIDLGAKLGTSCVMQSLALGSLIATFIAYVPSDPTTLALVKANALVINGSPDLSWLAKSIQIIRANGGPQTIGVLSITNPIVVIVPVLPPYPTRAPRTYLIPSSASGVHSLLFLLVVLVASLLADV